MIPTPPERIKRLVSNRFRQSCRLAVFDDNFQKKIKLNLETTQSFEFHVKMEKGHVILSSVFKETE